MSETPVSNNEIIPEASTFRLQSVDCLMKMPIVESAFNQGASIYDKIKGANYIFNWALTTAEATVQKTIETASPLAHKFDKPIQMVDQGLVHSIQTLQAKLPIVNEEPYQIYEAAKLAISNAVQPSIDKVCAVKSYGENTALTLKELSYNKANELLSTQYGQKAVTGIDSTTALVDKLIDTYFPPNSEETVSEPVLASDDPVLHTAQTVGRLSSKAARRVYTNVSHQLKSMNVTDVREYVSSLVAVLQLTQLLYFFGQNDKNEKEDEQKKSEEKPSLNN